MIPAISVWAFVLLPAVVPFEEHRFNSVFEQETQFTCGIASAASLASFYWGIDVAEDDLLGLLAGSDVLYSRERKAISLQDLQLLLVGLGFETGGFELDYAHLVRASRHYGPLICHLDAAEGHFVLFLGDMHGFAVLGDPARGCVAVTAEEFISLWSHTALAVYHPERAMRKEVVVRVLREVAVRLSTCAAWCLR
jgi:hypothetical protein